MSIPEITPMASPNPATTDWVPMYAMVPSAGLPADTVVAAATRIISNILASGDTQPAWQVLGSGKMNWGPGGTTAVDTNLYRSAASVLKTDGQFQAASDIYSQYGLSMQIRIGNSSGNAAIEFGPFDTRLYRSAAGQLQTDGVLGVSSNINCGSYVQANVGGANATILGYNLGGNAPAVAFIDSGGTTWDTSLFRQGAGLMQMHSALQVEQYLYSINGPVYAGTGVYIGYTGGSDIFLDRSAAATMRCSATWLYFTPANAGLNVMQRTQFYEAAANAWYNYASGYGTHYAAVFSVQSDRAMKTEIAPVEVPVRKLLDAGIYTYKRQGSDKHHLGLLADELPELVTEIGPHAEGGETTFVDLYKLSTALLAAVQDIDKRLQAIEGRN
jgi:hypothetical protein